MDFALLPPEVNSARMYAGPGTGPMLAAASAWDGLSAELPSTAATYRAAITELTGGPWLGSSSASMTAAVMPYLDWMTTSAAQAEHTATQALSAAAAPAAVDPLSLLPLLTVPLTATAATVGTIGITSSFTSFGTTVRGLLINADRDYDNGRGPFTGNGVGGTMLPQWIINGTGGIGAPSDAVPASEGAGLGQARKVGRLSVPPGWTAAAPELRPAAFTLPITSAAAVPEAGGAGNLFSGMGLAGAAGGAVGSTASAGRGNERVRLTPRQQNPKPSQQPPNEAVTAIATELQELATRAQSLLAKLAESGLLSTEEVTEQKRRFLG